MTIGEICTRQVVVALKGQSVRHAAQMMREHHVGTLIVTEAVKGQSVPAGVLTDRDIVVGVVAKGLDPETLSVGEIISPEVVVVNECDSLSDTAELMRVKGVRRLPVVNDRGALVGVVTADDLLGVMASGLSSLAKMVQREQRRESDQRP